MGTCFSTSNSSTCSSRSNGEKSRRGFRLFGQKRTKGTSFDHTMGLQNLASIPNRIIANGKSRSSCVFTQQGRKGINQDAMIVWEVKLMSFLNSHQSGQDGSEIAADLEKDGSAEEKSDSLWREVFMKTYKSMDKELKSHPKLDCFCSGSTAVTIVKQGSNLFIGYIGDSRAIMGSKDGNGSMLATQLTVDLKPDLPREAERIKRCKGRVFALQDEPEVSRVWLPFDDAPGLAMARAFGDFCLKEYGVISIPEFSHRMLTDRDQFIVLASDGVWDVLSNEEVVEIVSSARARSSAARLLIDAAAKQWKLKYPTSKMDDCAVVCLYLDGKMDSESEGFSISNAAPESDNLQNEDDSSAEPCLQRNVTVRSSVGVVVEDEGWSGLEGVTRVNSLVQLPRFSDEIPTTSSSEKKL
ncbi:Probable protein phosphatase 2C 1 [Linum perenne]